MRRLFFVLLLLLCASGASADSTQPCATMTLAQLISSGGCLTANGISYSNFTYSTTLVPGGTDVLASNVMVSFITNHPSQTVTFSSSWFSGAISNVAFGYNVTLPAGGYSGGGGATGYAIANVGGGSMSMSISSAGCGGVLWSDSGSHMGISSMGLTNRSGCTNPQRTGPFTINGSFDQGGPDFTTTAFAMTIDVNLPPVTPVPEPGSLVLISWGLLPILARLGKSRT